MIVRRMLLTLALFALWGCAPALEQRVQAISTPGTERIPVAIAIYPLLSTAMPQPIHAPERRYQPAGTTAKEDRMYIVPPVEMKLAVTMQSQMLTSQLSAELTRRGFSLKEIPVEVPENQEGQEENTFFVSLAALKHLRDAYGVKAVILGNAYFIPDSVDPTGFDVGAAYLRVVDTETLDVLCQVTLSDSYGGDGIEEVARAFAQELARKAELAPVQ